MILLYTLKTFALCPEIHLGLSDYTNFATDEDRVQAESYYLILECQYAFLHNTNNHCVAHIKINPCGTFVEDDGVLYSSIDTQFIAQNLLIFGTMLTAEQHIVMHGKIVALEQKTSRQGDDTNQLAASILVALQWINFQFSQLGFDNIPLTGTIE